jgi:hypothetical protein
LIMGALRFRARLLGLRAVFGFVRAAAGAQAPACPEGSQL